jgi:hypothetical protein
MYRYIQNMHLYFKLSQFTIENAENDNNVLCITWYMNLTIVTSSLKTTSCSSESASTWNCGIFSILEKTVGEQATKWTSQSKSHRTRIP